MPAIELANAPPAQQPESSGELEILKSGSDVSRFISKRLESESPSQLLRWLGVICHAGDVDPYKGLIPHNPCVVPRRDE
jgi:hypothetical protein